MPTPTENTVEKRIENILVTLLDISPDRIVPEARFHDDFSTDSLDDVELIMGAEEEFDIEIPDEDAEHILTVQDAIDYIKSRVEK